MQSEPLAAATPGDLSIAGDRLLPIGWAIHWVPAHPDMPALIISEDMEMLTYVMKSS